VVSSQQIAQAMRAGTVPVEVATDGALICPRVLDEVLTA
jgi:hypothetical protein